MIDRKPIRFKRFAPPALHRTTERGSAEPRPLFDAEYPTSGMGMLLKAPSYKFDIPDDILREAIDLRSSTAEMVSRALDGLEAKVMDAARAAWADGMDFAVSIGTIIRDDRHGEPSYTMTLSKTGGPVLKGTEACPGFLILRAPG